MDYRKMLVAVIRGWLDDEGSVGSFHDADLTAAEKAELDRIYEEVAQQRYQNIRQRAQRSGEARSKRS